MAWHAVRASVLAVSVVTDLRTSPFALACLCGPLSSLNFVVAALVPVFREVVLFLMRMDLSTQLRRASTMENQGAVRLIQSNLEEIEAYLQELERDKRANASTAGKGSADGAASDGEEGAAATDPVAKGLQLRGDLQRAVEAEDYAECARIRDELAALEAAAFASEAAAAVRRNARGAVELHLGAKVRGGVKAYNIYIYIGFHIAMRV